ncbi:hormogonium polysaccharide secretion pseudopilin HpsB [Moorena sp. SIO2C4]|uniref:hormogonium polysaccharide secretion pseudopilin HpsB n=1 Tax=Moorena sp. SIO2C4 TaxID=2607824 RepID=UPI0013C85D59|nr:hormogonium polysaccharide secretion pseudopilin HpsB [Moorena sp. SIO2C4]NES41941.1 prepilin-type N-terminal cleavage/methylation domain-containing protein [Moorena sp. SIO2C4]
MINPQKQQPLCQSSDAGFTIMESLMAMLIITILMLGISPMIVLGVANRVQSRRVELGVQAARAYIDGVRTGAIEHPKHELKMELEDGKNRSDFAKTEAPKPSNLTCDKNAYCENEKKNSIYCIDLDEGGCSSESPRDLIIQAFRSITSSGDPSNNIDKSYFLGVRVYRADAFKDKGDLTIGEKGAKAKARGPGLSDRKAPLVEMTTEITTGKPDFSLFCQRLGGCK